MNAQPAKDNYIESHPARTLFRRPAEVISLPQRRSERQSPPEQNMDQPHETRTANSGPDSGTRITLGDIPGDFDSLHTIWTKAPEPLCDLVGRVTAAREQGDALDIAMAAWAVLVLIPRGLFHLASWIFTHPLRLLAAAVLMGLFLATL
jgi:hypothetical protein